MKKTELELSQLFDEKISPIFEESRKLPNYGQSNSTFIARPRDCHTFDKINNILFGLNGVEVEEFKSVGNTHIINFSDETRIVIIYAKDKNDFKWLYNYHSYTNSIILGKILKSAGLKYSEKGLQYLQYDLRENHKSVVGTIDITKDFSQILEILELDVNEFEEGFISLVDFFKYIMKSPYFNAEKFINHEKEQRNFMLQSLEEYLILNNLENNKSEKLTFERVKELFSDIDFETEMNILLERAEKKKRIVDKLNGRVILDMIPDFEQTRIGLTMGLFKNSFESNEEYIDFMVDSSQKEVLSKFKEVNKLA